MRELNREAEVSELCPIEFTTKDYSLIHLFTIFRANFKSYQSMFRDNLWEDNQWTHQWWGQEPERISFLYFRQWGCGGHLTSEFQQSSKCPECRGHISRTKVQWVFSNKKFCLYLHKLSQSHWKIPIYLFWCSSLSQDPGQHVCPLPARDCRSCLLGGDQ